MVRATLSLSARAGRSHGPCLKANTGCSQAPADFLGSLRCLSHSSDGCVQAEPSFLALAMPNNLFLAPFLWLSQVGARRSWPACLFLGYKLSLYLSRARLIKCGLNVRATSFTLLLFLVRSRLDLALSAYPGAVELRLTCLLSRGRSDIRTQNF